MMCKLCEKYYQDYPLQEDGMHHLWHDGKCCGKSSPIQCAFDGDERIFSTENWACQTMLTLRDIAEEHGYHCRDDSDAASIGVIWISGHIVGENVQMGYIIMTWYKSRGKTGRAYVVCDDNIAQPLTQETAEKIIEYYQREVK